MSIYWADEELIVTVYYSSRGYTDAAIADVLGVRGYRRSAAAVRRKVEGVIGQYPHLLSASGKWDLSEVDWWLDHLSLGHDAVNSLISCTALDAAIAEEVGGYPDEVDGDRALNIFKHQIMDRILDTLGQAMWYRSDYRSPTERQSSDSIDT